MRCSLQAERRYCPIKISRDIERQSPLGKIICQAILKDCPFMNGNKFLRAERSYNNPGIAGLIGLYPSMEAANIESLRDLSQAVGLCSDLKQQLHDGRIDFSIRDLEHFDPILSNGSLHY